MCHEFWWGNVLHPQKSHNTTNPLTRPSFKCHCHSHYLIPWMTFDRPTLLHTYRVALNSASLLELQTVFLHPITVHQSCAFQCLIHIIIIIIIVVVVVIIIIIIIMWIMHWNAYDWWTVIQRKKAVGNSRKREWWWNYSCTTSCKSPLLQLPPSGKNEMFH